MCNYFILYYKQFRLVCILISLIYILEYYSWKSWHIQLSYIILWTALDNSDFLFRLHLLLLGWSQFYCLFITAQPQSFNSDQSLGEIKLFRWQDWVQNPIKSLPNMFFLCKAWNHPIKVQINNKNKKLLYDKSTGCIFGGQYSMHGKWCVTQGFHYF